ncbi:ubiquitin carboxyl-terminal hydrolase 31 isoform X2 [Anthonomus grandis grandis]|uniref:ubiquitin carboxyl-terminal hydrolase 31 isoform X2 n=1 Tax=Anthonomus grandis grandis TaxID=2921223 RepID=UPI002166AD0E|nr:ubiquitin carboxyl-terminal hydrolase 31 isoform X2 [Anthonomus grandis grandis]
MCDLAFVKSNSAGELLNRIEMTLENGVQEASTLKRTFTLPRNPFNSARMSKRRPKTGDNEPENVRDLKIVNGDAEKNNKKVFRRPSIKKIISSINKIAQHISGVPGINQNLENNRVPPVDIQTWGPNDTPGVTGIENQGNTCFINAILQCISHTDILAEYFVLDKYKIDLARRNKLNSKKFGTKGEVTEQLAILLKALWACQYYSELSMSFKHVLGRHGSQYRGNQQHDAQEFLLWLLDKVHEDLNTASKKKYKSVKTSGRPDEVIAAETLENYRRCNNSFIQGVFQAQYRSSLSCSRCRTQSNTFDPFQCISVQLPQFHKQSIYVTVVYTSQQPRQVQIGLSLPSGSSIGELRAILESDTSIEKESMLLTEIGECGFMRTFNNSQSISMISEIDPIYCIETAQLEENNEEITSAYVLLCWINVVRGSGGGEFTRFGSPYTMQVSRETSYDDLQKLLLKEMAPILHDDILTSSQSKGVFKMRISDPAWNETEPPCYLEPHLEHPLFMEAVDQALALCSDDGGPAHVKLVLEWTESARMSIIADQSDAIEEHSTVKMLRAQALQGGAPLTLQECLQDYTGAETLTDAWRCPHCKQYQPVVKTLDVWSLPDILIVHFKRFRQHTIRGANSSKLTTMVDFPVNGFDMSPHLASKRHPQNLPQNNMTESEMISINNGWSPWKRARKQSNCHENVYDLYGVCYHHGSDLETGHYTAACKNPYDQNWYLYDDAKVVNLSKDSDDVSSVLVNNRAYILFYQRRCMGNSNSSNSSAASTSSVGSGSDHWVTRMPKFVPPKFAPAIVKPPEKKKPYK